MAQLFSMGVNPFSVVCPFHFYGICNQYRLFSGGDTGKISVLNHIISFH